MAMSWRDLSSICCSSQLQYEGRSITDPASSRIGLGRAVSYWPPKLSRKSVRSVARVSNHARALSSASRKTAERPEVFDGHLDQLLPPHISATRQ